MKTDAIEACIKLGENPALPACWQTAEEANYELAAMREALAKAEDELQKFRDDDVPGFVVLKTPARYKGRDDEFRDAIVGAMSNESCHAARLEAMKKAEDERNAARAESTELRRWQCPSRHEESPDCDAVKRVLERARRLASQLDAARAEVERMRKPVISSEMLIRASNSRIKELGLSATEWQAFIHGFEDGAMWAQGLKYEQAAQAGK